MNKDKRSITKMKTARVLFLVLLLSGCVTMEKIGNQMRNLEQVAQYRPNLVGMTQQQILDMLGHPDNVVTSHSNFGTIEIWTYEYMSVIFPYTRTIIHITFTNGVVTDVSYW